MVISAGEVITLEFVDFMRNEKRFANTDKLSAQLATDARKVRRLTAKLL